MLDMDAKMKMQALFVQNSPAEFKIQDLSLVGKHIQGLVEGWDLGLWMFY